MDSSGYKDEYDNYGEHIAIQTRKLGDRRLTAITTYKIDQVILDASMGECLRLKRSDEDRMKSGDSLRRRPYNKMAQRSVDDQAEGMGSRKLQKIEEILEKVKYMQQVLTLDRNEFDVYGEHVAYQLRKFKDKILGAQVRRKINDILFAAVMGEFNLKNLDSK